AGEGAREKKRKGDRREDQGEGEPPARPPPGDPGEGEAAGEHRGDRPFRRPCEPRDQEDRDEPGLGREPPRERRHPPAPENREEDGEAIAEGMVESEAKEGDDDLDADRDRPPLVLAERVPPRPDRKSVV